MDVRVSLTNFVTFALYGFVAVWVIDKGLSMAGLSAYSATGAK